MSVETEMYVIKNKKEDDLEDSFSVYPGGFEKTKFLGGNVDLVIFCDVDNTKGTVWILADEKSREVNAIKYRNDEDIEGEEVNVSKPIKIQGEETLSVFNRRGEERQAYIFFDLEEDLEDDSPFEIPTDSKPLVLV